jgi:hypothetical protein
LAIEMLRRKGRCVEVELGHATPHLLLVLAAAINALRFGSILMRLSHSFLQSIALLSS